MPVGAASRADVWLFRPERDDPGQNLTAAADREFAAVMNGFKAKLTAKSVSGPTP